MGACATRDGVTGAQGNARGYEHMAVFLGVDTGGTYTDAVVIKDQELVLASAKSLTTRHDLALGIGASVARVLEQAKVSPQEVDLVSLSTTLATNALVEGQGGRVALIYIGFGPKDIAVQGLEEALRGDPCLVCAGGHDHAGLPVTDLDEDAIRNFVQEHAATVSAFAIAAQFATRNPAHEQAAARIVAQETARPVSASHHLSSKLNGPKRALTAVLNARLIGMIDRLIVRATAQLTTLGITAPLMVVRGDGALISASEALKKPIETILSGPAASIVGACWLTGAQDALVSDIGGTTTDIALLQNGRPAIDPAGARVGPFRTMVEAVGMRTTGLGGDSEAHLHSAGLQSKIVLGPRRCLPVALLATEAADVVHGALEAQLRSKTPSEMHARFVRAVPGLPAEGLSDRDAGFLLRLGDAVWPMDKAVRTRLDLSTVERLVQRGLVQIAAPTPSDASHVAGLADFWDREAAAKALTLLSRRRSGAGECVAASADDLAQQILAAVTDQTATALLEVALAEEPLDEHEGPGSLATHVLLKKGLAGHRGLLAMDAALNVPVIGLGASAATYYPAVGEYLRTQMTVPHHADVANAIGAVVGQIIARCSGTITAPSEGKYRVHVSSRQDLPDFPDYEKARAALEGELRAQASADAARDGAGELHFTVKVEEDVAEVENRKLLIEARLTVEASGRPRQARG